jgi:hypothetical protein
MWSGPPRRTKASVAIRRYFPKDELPDGYSFTARTGEYQGGVALFVGLEGT